jgi:multisubunit Na+/H+ antiporter MnhG subunit
MRAHQAAGFAYWLLAAIYLLAALGGALASGHVGELPVELAVRAPALLIAGPVAAGRLAQAATQAGVDALCGESQDFHDIVRAWSEGFTADMRANAAINSVPFCDFHHQFA